MVACIDQKIQHQNAYFVVQTSITMHVIIIFARKLSMKIKCIDV